MGFISTVYGAAKKIGAPIDRKIKQELFSEPKTPKTPKPKKPRTPGSSTDPTRSRILESGFAPKGWRPGDPDPAPEAPAAPKTIVAPKTPKEIAPGTPKPAAPKAPKAPTPKAPKKAAPGTPKTPKAPKAAAPKPAPAPTETMDDLFDDVNVEMPETEETEETGGELFPEVKVKISRNKLLEIAKRF